MKIAVAGKGGVGKTTFTSLMAHLYAKDKRCVIAVDADTSMNLAYSLGFSEQLREKIVPLCEMKKLIEERAGTKKGGGLFILNPKVDDLAEKIGIVKDGIRLVVMGTIEQGGEGCACPVNTVLKNFLNHLFLSSEDALIVDMEAGIEHLGRATAGSVEAMVIVLEPTFQSVDVAKRITALAGDIGIKNILIVGNKIAGEKDEEYIKRCFNDNIIGFIPFIPEFRELFERDNFFEFLPPALIERIKAIKLTIEEKTVVNHAVS